MKWTKNIITQKTSAATGLKKAMPIETVKPAGANKLNNMPLLIYEW
jgi:hypothetical protein